MITARSPLWMSAAARGASFIARGQIELARHYGDPALEYDAAVKAAAVYDASHYGRVRVTGEDALDLLNRLSTNKVDTLSPGRAAMTVLVDDRGRIVDLLTVTNLGDELLLLTSPGMASRVVEWLDKYTFSEDVAFTDITGETAALSLLGPDAPRLLAGLAGVDIAAALEGHVARVQASGARAVLALRRPPVLPSWDMVVSAGDAQAVWMAALRAGALPLGEEAWQALRVERGVPESGHELTDDYNPLEAGLSACVSLDKGCYIGQEVLARLDTYKKLQRRLAMLRFPGHGPVEGDALELAGSRVGSITSLATRPTDDAFLGLGFVRTTVADQDVLDVTGRPGVQAVIIPAP